jgi:N-acetylated-alpha-linked acidic dipeptidase
VTALAEKLVLAAVLCGVPALCQSPLRGFPQDEWKSHRELEEKARAIPQPERIRTYMEHMSAQPHHAGSAGSKAVADYTAAQLREWGFDVQVERFDALIPYPTTRLLEMTAPVKFKAELREPPVPEDKDTADPAQLPTFNAYSGAGDVTGPLVYVNYGTPEDYEYLRKLGVDVKGKIVLARYGRSWRGVKPKLAQEHGALGCLIFSDPREDGYFQGDPYPKGPTRPEQGVQRGSVLDMALYPGDPLTPGYASEPGAKRLAMPEAKTLLKIPVMPISWGDARPLLEQLGGNVVPEDWRGALPITYHLGPGPATVHLKLDFDWSNKPLYDVVATIPGTSLKDEWVIYGNHHDAWVNGASDPASGAAVLMETARTLSLLRKQGWQPKRTIVLALWDGEEFGLIGSTEWAEKHQEELKKKAAVYLNSDSNGPGNIAIAGSNTLEIFMREVVRDLPDLGIVRKNKNGDKSRRGFRMGALGAGSDYVAFLDHLGVASLNMSFNGSDAGGVYHSIYDTMAWFRRFSDGDLSYGRALAQAMTTTLMRLGDSSVLPFEFGALERAVDNYTTEIEKDAQKVTQNAIDFRELRQQRAQLSFAARAYEEELNNWSHRTAPLPAEKMVKLNDLLTHAEQSLLLPEGLAGRDWYRHSLYAPGIYTGYLPKTLPGIREAAEAQKWDDANRETKRVAAALRAMTAQVEEATRILRP